MLHVHNEPFSERLVMTRLTVISILNPQKFFIFVFKKKCMDIITLFFLSYYRCIKLQKIVYANERVFLIQRLWEGW